VENAIASPYPAPHNSCMERKLSVWEIAFTCHLGMSATLPSKYDQTWTSVFAVRLPLKIQEYLLSNCKTSIVSSVVQGKK
jgi:hypothetical protein